MITVPAITKSYGSFIHESPLDTIDYWANPSGVITSQSTYQEMTMWGYSYRAEYSRNPQRFLSGTSTIWRDPSTYRRDIMRFNREGPVRWILYKGPDGTTYNRFSPLSNRTVYCLSIPKWYNPFGHVEPDENQDARARTEALLKIGDGKAQLAVSIIEAKKTANMLAGIAIPFFKSLLYAKRGQWHKIGPKWGITKRSVFTGKASAQRLLEIKYGWLPTMGELHGLHEMLKEQLKPALLITGKRNIEDVLKVTSKDVNLAGYGNQDCKVTGHVHRIHSYSMTGRLNDVHLYNAQRSGLINPLAVGWELVPYSFVVDWAVPIGNVLEALTATAGVDFVGGHRTIAGSAALNVEQHPQPNQTGEPRKGRIEAMSTKRYKLNSWPRPAVYTKSPFKTSNVLTALGLIRQLFK